MAGAGPEHVSTRARSRLRNEMVTPGSGNHYLEVQRVVELFATDIAAAFGLAVDDAVVSVRCGSRGLGHQIGTAVVTDRDHVEPRDEVVIECEAADLDELFFDWIDAVVFEMSTRQMLLGRFDVRIENGHLRGDVWGEPVDRARHEPAVEIKGRTYTELRVSHDSSKSEWTAQCVVDV
jgi:tRNA nucleotidyltransferase (CCA-adding enzyme)